MVLHWIAVLAIFSRFVIFHNLGSVQPGFRRPYRARGDGGLSPRVSPWAIFERPSGTGREASGDGKTRGRFFTHHPQTAPQRAPRRVSSLVRDPKAFGTLFVQMTRPYGEWGFEAPVTDGCHGGG